MRRLVLPAAFVAGLLLPAPVVAEPASLSLALSAQAVVYGDPVTLSGAIAPAEAGAEVALELGTPDGWATLTTVTTDAAGAFAATVAPAGGGPVRARAVTSGSASPEVPLAVAPRVSLDVGRGRAFVGAPLRALIEPASYSGAVALTVRRAGRVVGRSSAVARAGALRTTVPTPGLGAFRVELSFPGSGLLAARVLETRVSARGRTLAPGARGPDVRGLHRRLAELRFHLPGISASYSSATADAVIAFQKGWGLPRTGVVDARTGRALAGARVLRPRFARPALHIEIDKSRQILMVVRGGAVEGVIPVSSGATGNTPVGAFRIRWKAPATSTWLGSAILYRTLTFHGNFAIHGYPSVPTYPASHGCVRIPIWAANWLYVRSPVGERVYVYP